MPTDPLPIAADINKGIDWLNDVFGKRCNEDRKVIVTDAIDDELRRTLDLFRKVGPLVDAQRVCIAKGEEAVRELNNALCFDMPSSERRQTCRTKAAEFRLAQQALQEF